ncbi:hypothetical protein H8D30_01790, partial [bacterium]|nr:hypothetical protein [bacterium]
PQRAWRGTVSGVLVASDALHPAALLRNIRPFLAKEASVVLARPDRSGVDPAFFLSDRPSRDALERGISFHSGGHLPEDLAHFLGHLAVLVAHDTARLPGFTLGTDALVSTLGLPSSQGEDVLSRLEERGWVRSVRLHHLLSASPTGRLEVLGGPNLQAEVSRLCVPVGCTSAKRIRLNCEGRVLRELDAFQAATFLHHGKEMRWGDTVYRVTGHLSPARSGNLEVARGYRAETDTTGGDLGLNVTPLIELSGTKSLQSGPPILPFPDSLEEGLSEEGESLLFLPLLEGGVVALPSLDASWLSALADYAGEVFLGDLSQMRRWVGKNRRGQLALVPLSGSITVTIKGHRYRQARSSERGERQLPQPLTFERVGPFTALCSTLPTEAKAALFLAAKTLLPIQFEGLRDVLLFHHHSLKGLSWLERT